MFAPKPFIRLRGTFLVAVMHRSDSRAVPMPIISKENEIKNSNQSRLCWPSFIRISRLIAERHSALLTLTRGSKTEPPEKESGRILMTDPMKPITTRSRAASIEANVNAAHQARAESLGAAMIKFTTGLKALIRAVLPRHKPHSVKGRVPISLAQAPSTGPEALHQGAGFFSWAFPIRRCDQSSPPHARPRTR